MINSQEEYEADMNARGLHESQANQGDAEIAAKERYKAGEQMIFRDPEHLPKGMSGYIETYPLTREAFIAGAKWQASHQSSDKVQEKEIADYKKMVIDLWEKIDAGEKSNERLKGLIEKLCESCMPESDCIDYKRKNNL